MNSLITTPTSDYVYIGGHTHVYADDILYCEGDRNYSQAHCYKPPQSHGCHLPRHTGNMAG